MNYDNEKTNKPPMANNRVQGRKGRGSRHKLVKQRKVNVQNADSIEILSPSYKNAEFNVDINPYQTQLFSFT